MREGRREMGRGRHTVWWESTQQGNKLAETITYSDRPGGAVLLAGRRVGSERSPSCLGWMGHSLGTKLILGV